MVEWVSGQLVEWSIGQMGSPIIFRSCFSVVFAFPIQRINDLTNQPELKKRYDNRI
jgi:hypothetical protein